MITLHRAGRLTWPALIIHIFIILLGLANLIAQFLLWKLPFLQWLSQLVLWYLATALSNTVRHEDQSSMGGFWEKLHLWNKFKTHHSSALQETCLASLKSQSYERWNGSHLSDTVLLVLLKVHQKVTMLKYFNILQHISPNKASNLKLWKSFLQMNCAYLD